MNHNALTCVSLGIIVSNSVACPWGAISANRGTSCDQCSLFQGAASKAGGLPAHGLCRHAHGCSSAGLSCLAAVFLASSTTVAELASFRLILSPEPSAASAASSASPIISVIIEPELLLLLLLQVPCFLLSQLFGVLLFLLHKPFDVVILPLVLSG